MLRSEGDRLTRVVVCTPEEEYFRVGDSGAHNIPESADPERTRDQHGRLKSIMMNTHCDVIDVAELSGHPNSVFTRDVSLSTPKGYVQLRMGLESRRGEEQWMSRILSSQGEPQAGMIHEPGSVEGGDVILAGEVAFVGRSKRTNREGVEQISEILEAMDFEVRVVSVPEGCLHLGGAVSVIGPHQVLCAGDDLPDETFEGFEIIRVPGRGPSTGNIICLGAGEVIGNVAENAETLRILKEKGIQVHAVDLSEFRKGAGGPTCLILPLERK